jgi:transketolase
MSQRQQFVKTVTDILEKDERVVLLLGDIGVYGFREAFERFPKRVYNIGILEQASVSMAAGLAAEGMIPIFHTIAPFMVERALEQIKVDFGYQKLVGNFVSVGASYDYAALGCTHHCPGDVQILKTIPGMKIFVPGHPTEFDDQFFTNYDTGVNYYRLSERSNLYPFYQGYIRRGTGGTVVAVGPMLDRVLEACEGLSLDILYRNVAEPFFNTSTCTRGAGTVVVEPFYEGTLSHDVKESSDTPVLHIGVPRQFLTNYGTAAEHDEKNHLTSARIRERIIGFLNL